MITIDGMLASLDQAEKVAREQEDDVTLARVGKVRLKFLTQIACIKPLDFSKLTKEEVAKARAFAEMNSIKTAQTDGSNHTQRVQVC